MNKHKRRYQNSGYSSGGASRDKPSLKSFLPSHYSAKTDIDFNLQTLRSRAADLAINSPIGAAAINASTSNVISSGLKLFPRINPKLLNLTPEKAVDWSRRTKAEFELWAGSLDADFFRRNNFYELQRIAYVSYLTDGDCFCLFKRRPPAKNLPYSLCLQLVEAARVSNPITNSTQTSSFMINPVEIELSNGRKIISGIEIDSSGQFTAIWVSNRIWDEPLSTTPTLKWQRVKIFGENGNRNVLHICNDTRTEQFRGVPYLAPVIEAIKQVSRYADAELTSSIIKSFFSIFFTQNIATSGFDLNQILPNSEETDEAIEKVMREYKLGAGTITSLPRGVDVKAVDRQNAQSSFEAFISSYVKQIGAALNLPYEVLLKNFQSSYSASRAALIQAEDEFRQRRAAFVNDFCKPIYETFLTEAVALGRIEAPGFFDDVRIKQLWTQAEFFTEGSHLIDPVKELQGSQLKIALGLSTREAEAAQLTGTDFYQNVEALNLEKNLLPVEKLPSKLPSDDEQNFSGQSP